MAREAHVADFTREEIEAHWKIWRDLVDRRDLDGMAERFTEDARGGNAVLGICEGREAIAKWTREEWPESVPNRGVWTAIDGNRVVHKWRETLPGTPPEGAEPYDYFGISEFIYAGDGKWSFMYGLPDVYGLQQVYARWKADGQAEIHGDVYPYM